METDLYRKFARIGQFSATNDPVIDQKALENNYLDIINYCKLQLIYLRKNYWQNRFSWEIINNNFIVPNVNSNNQSHESFVVPNCRQQINGEKK